LKLWTNLHQNESTRHLRVNGIHEPSSDASIQKFDRHSQFQPFFQERPTRFTVRLLFCHSIFRQFFGPNSGQDRASWLVPTKSKMKWLPWRKKSPPQDTGAAGSQPPRQNHSASPGAQGEGSSGRASQSAGVAVGNAEHPHEIRPGTTHFAPDSLLSPSYRSYTISFRCSIHPRC
jgi:hypothetical protein